MGGKTSKSTQTVSIPPEVLARYNAVNARAEQAAGTPFQPYSYNPADFAAQLTPTQLAGIQNVNYAAGQAQPYYDEATGQLMGAQMAAVPYYGQAEADIYGGQQMGQQYQQQALNALYGGQYGAVPFQQAAAYNIGAAQDIGAQLAQQAYAQQALAGAGAMPLQQAAYGTLGRAGQMGEAVAGQALGSLAGAGYAAQPLQQLAQGIYGQAYQAAQPYTQMALQQYFGGLGGAAPISQAALANLAAGQQMGQDVTGMALSQLGLGQMQAAPIQQAAIQAVGAAPFAAAPLTGAAQQNILAAQAGFAPYQQAATQLGLAGARAVTPTALGAPEIQQYMSPYLSNVVGQTQALLNQQAQQAQAEQLGNAIRSGAFGGDRAAIAAANLQQQQQLAQGKVLGDLLQSGYGQALATAQQQQQLGLTAEQANRAAQQQAAAQLLGVGQTGFGQGMTAAQQQAALAQQLYGQQLGAGQAQAALAQQLFGQGATAAQQQQAAAQALFGQSAQAAQQQAALAQQIFGQQAATGQNIAGLGQQAFGQGLSAGQAQQALAQQLFGQGATTAQQQAAIAQALFGQGATQAQQQAALAQQVFGQGLSQAQQQAALSQLLYGQGTGAAQQQAALGQQIFGQGLSAAQQQAALGQQGFAQQLAAAQARQGLGQGLYGMGAGTAQQLAALGAGAQGAALQGAQAQLAAGQAQQQTAQAGLQALYNQFLQQQAYPFQVAQFLGNIAMGTGALTGSTTTTAQPGSLFSDIRTKENVRKVGETFDKQPIYSFNYKGDPKTQMGLIAQEVERKHPEAVGLAGGLKTVDYERATRNAARRGEVIDAEFSPISEGGSVTPSRAGLGFADGGMPPIVDDDAQKKAEDEMRRQQADEVSRQAAKTAVNTAREPVKTTPAPQVDLKPDLAAQKQSQTPSSVPSTLGIPTDTKPTPQLAVASGDGLYKTDPRSKDADTLVQAAALAATLLSDRRLKEDVKHIGHTYDGQKIYSYRIKGEPHTQIGLMADEVEERAPDAVGSVNGFKTVDYDRATEVAAKAGRRHLADGGSPGLASPSDMAALLAAQAQMFGPYSQFGRPTGGTPGTPGYVPGANLPVAGLVTAGDLPSQASTAEDLRNLYGIGKDIYETRNPPAPPKAPAPSPSPVPAKTETEVPGALAGRSSEDFDENFEKNRYRGGLAYADGGQVIPYSSPTALNIPTEIKTPELIKAGQLPKQRSTMEDVKDLLGIAEDTKDLYDKINPEKKSHGGLAGRHAYQDGGGNPNPLNSMLDVLFNPRASKTYTGFPPVDRAIEQAMQRQDTRSFRGTGATGSFEGAPAPVRPDATPRVRPVSDTSVSGAPITGSSSSAAPTPPAGGLAPASAAPTPPVAAPPAANAPVTTPPAGGLAPPPPAGATAAPEKKPGIMDWLKKPENYIPLLQGAAAAATAPTQYTLPALLVGASAYGKSYQDVRQRLAEIETEKATAEQLKGGTRETNARIAQMMQNNQIVTDGGREFVVFADNSRMLLGQYLALTPEQRAKLPLLGQGQIPSLISAAGMPGAAVAPPVTTPAAPQPTLPAAAAAPPVTQVTPPTTQVVPSATQQPPQNLAQVGETQFRQNAPTAQKKWLGSVGEQQYKQDLARLQGMSTEEKQRLITENAKYQANIDAGAQAAVGMGQNLNQMTSMILKLPEGGITAPGALAPIRNQAVRIANDIIGTIAGAVGANPNDYQINEDDIAKGTAVDKIGRFMAFAAANGADQNSLGGLETAKAMVPTTAQSKEEAVQLLAGMYIDKQRALDMQNYVREYVALGTSSGMPEAVLINNAMNAFRREEMYNDRAYNERKRALAALMERKNSAGVSMFEHMMKKGYSPEVIDQKASEALYGRKDVPPIRGMANIILGI